MNLIAFIVESIVFYCHEAYWHFIGIEVQQYNTRLMQQPDYTVLSF